MSFADSAQLSGIPEGTFYRWKAQGEKAKKGRYREFYEAVNRASAAATEVLIGIAYKAAIEGREEVEIRETKDANGAITGTVTTRRKVPRDGRLAMQILERRHPERYGRQVIQHEGFIHGGGGGSVEGVTINLFFDDGESEGNSAPPITTTETLEEIPA